MSHPALQQAVNLGQELVEMLGRENEFIRTHDTKAIEANTPRKEALVEEFQAALKAIKADLTNIKTSPTLAPLHAKLKELLQTYNEVARRNVVLLQAAHTSSTSFINIVRQAITPPTPKTYGKDGQMRESTGPSTPILAKSV